MTFHGGNAMTPIQYTCTQSSEGKNEAFIKMISGDFCAVSDDGRLSRTSLAAAVSNPFFLLKLKPGAEDLD